MKATVEYYLIVIMVLLSCYAFSLPLILFFDYQKKKFREIGGRSRPSDKGGGGEGGRVVIHTLR